MTKLETAILCLLTCITTFLFFVCKDRVRLQESTRPRELKRSVEKTYGCYTYTSAGEKTLLFTCDTKEECIGKCLPEKPIYCKTTKEGKEVCGENFGFLYYDSFNIDPFDGKRTYYKDGKQVE